MNRVAFAIIFFIPSLAHAQIVPDEKDREADMFGDDFSETEVATKHRDLLDLDRLQVGGMIYMRYGAYYFEGAKDDPTLDNPNLLDVYLDGQPNDRVRAYVRGRLSFNPMRDGYGPGMPDFTDLQVPEGTDLPEPPPSTDVFLDQFWLKFDIGRTLFVTAGKQPVHWGATRLWNPVDVVNATRREPLALFDDRTGVAALKVQIPIESLSWNVVALALVEGADSVDDIGGALRLEMVVATAEVGLTGMVRTQDPVNGGAEVVPRTVGEDDGLSGAEKSKATDSYTIPKIGLDLSAGIWEFDVTGEVAMTFAPKEEEAEEEPMAAFVCAEDLPQPDPFFETGERDVALQASGGLAYSVKYSAEDYLIIGGEYFFNSQGYANKDRYFGLMMTGQYTPFYVGRHYGALYLMAPAPGNWDHTSFMLSGLSNLSDGSYLTRFDYSTSVLTYLGLQAYVSVNLGERGGEFRLGFDKGHCNDLYPAVPFPVATVGLNLRVDI